MSVCTKKPLLSASQLSDGNFLSVTLEAAYSVPEAFVPTGPSHNYMACLQVPAVGKVRLGPGTARWVSAAAEQVVVPHHGTGERPMGVQPWCFCNADKRLRGRTGDETGSVFPRHDFFSPSLYACGGVCSSSQAPALLPCFVKHSLEQLALAFARVGSRSLFILVSL